MSDGVQLEGLEGSGGRGDLRARRAGVQGWGVAWVFLTFSGFQKCRKHPGSL